MSRPSSAKERSRRDSDIADTIKYVKEYQNVAERFAKGKADKSELNEAYKMMKAYESRALESSGKPSRNYMDEGFREEELPAKLTQREKNVEQISNMMRRNPLKNGGEVKKYASGGSIDGCAIRGRTRG